MIDAGGARPRDDLDGLIEHLVDAERRLTVAFAKAGVDSSVLNDMRLLSNAAVALRGLRWRIAALEEERDALLAVVKAAKAMRERCRYEVAGQLHGAACAFDAALEKEQT